MNLTITPLNNRNNSYRAANYNRPSFRANPAEAVVDVADDMAAKLATQKSGFFKPLEEMYDKMTDKLAEKFSKAYIESGFIETLADTFKDSKNLFQHVMTVGSVITSGLYMQRTYSNKKLEKDRRNTLVVNQGLTLGVSTAGAYLLDRYVKGWWDDVTARFAGHMLGDEDFYKGYIAKKNDIKEANKKLIKEKGKNVKLQKMESLKDLLAENELYKGLGDSKELFDNKIKGMGLIRTMLVFGFVYRFFVPVVVTKPANKLCDMYLEHKRAKKEA